MSYEPILYNAYELLIQTSDRRYLITCLSLDDIIDHNIQSHKDVRHLGKVELKREHTILFFAMNGYGSIIISDNSDGLPIINNDLDVLQRILTRDS